MLWFANEEVDVVGHHDVSGNPEVVAVAGSLDGVFYEFPDFGGSEVAATTVATESEEVEVACFVKPY